MTAALVVKDSVLEEQQREAEESGLICRKGGACFIQATPMSEEEFKAMEAGTLKLASMFNKWDKKYG